MKFVSKYSNYRVTLRQGLEGSRALGTATTPGIYVKFEDGAASVDNEEMVKMMLDHPAFNKDFIIADPTDAKVHELEMNRRSSEPAHNLTQMEYGHVGKAMNPRPDKVLGHDQQVAMQKIAEKMAMDIAVPMAKEMAIKMVQELAKGAGDIKSVDGKKTPASVKAPAPIEDEKDADQYPDEDILETPDVPTPIGTSAEKFVCKDCGLECKSRISLLGHSRKHSKK